MNWPIVKADDPGIRPAGKPDECFYCLHKVGDEHARDCVIITKRVEHEVTLTWSDGSKTTGTWQFDEPYFWDVYGSEFHKNESSWCANNLERYLDSTSFDEAVKTRFKDHCSYGNETPCACMLLSPTFKFVRIVDPTPRYSTS